MNVNIFSSLSNSSLNFNNYQENKKSWSSDIFDISIDFIQNKTASEFIGLKKIFLELKINEKNDVQIKDFLLLINKIFEYTNKNLSKSRHKIILLWRAFLGLIQENLHQDKLDEELLIVKEIIEKFVPIEKSAQEYERFLRLISNEYILSPYLSYLLIKDPITFELIALHELKHSPDSVIQNLKNFGITNLNTKIKLANALANKKNEGISKYLDLLEINEPNIRLNLFFEKLVSEHLIEKKAVTQNLTEKCVSILTHTNPKIAALFKEYIREEEREKIFDHAIERGVCFNAIQFFDQFGIKIENLDKYKNIFFELNYPAVFKREYIKTDFVNKLAIDSNDDFKKLLSIISESKIVFDRLMENDKLKKLIKENNFIIDLNQFTFESLQIIFRNIINFFSSFDPSNIENNEDFFVKYNREILDFFHEDSYKIFYPSINLLNSLKKCASSKGDSILKREINETKQQIERQMFLWLNYLKTTHHQGEKLSRECDFMHSLMNSALKRRMWELATNLAHDHLFKKGHSDIEKDKSICGSDLKWKCISNAVEHRKFRFLHYLLKNKLPISNPVDYTPLHLAAFDLNNRNMLAFLERRKFTDDSISKYGFTPSYIADALEIEFTQHLNSNSQLINSNSQLKKEIYDRKLLANIWAADRKSVISIPTQTKTFSLEGNLPTIGPKEIARFFELFTAQYSQEHPILLKVKDILHNDIRPYTPADRVLKEFQNGEILNFPTGYGLKIMNEHAHIIQLLVVDKYLLICNRGGGQKGNESILITEIDRSCSTLTLEHIEKLKKGWWERPEWEEFIYHKLPELAGAVKDQSQTKGKFKTIIQKNQPMGNCWWISSITAVFGLLLTLKTLEQERSQKVSKELIYDQAKTIYKQFTYFCKVAVLSEYLRKKIDEKKKNRTDSIAPDTDLIREVLLKFSLKHYSKNVDQASKIGDLVKEFDSLYQTDFSSLLKKCRIMFGQQNLYHYQMLKTLRGEPKEVHLKNMIYDIEKGI